MSRMGSLVLEIQEAIANGKRYGDIARSLDVPVKWVFEAANMMDDMENNSEPNIAELSGLISEASGDM